VAVLGGLLELTKLRAAGWLAANWRHAGKLLAAVMVALVAGLPPQRIAPVGRRVHVGRRAHLNPGRKTYRGGPPGRRRRGAGPRDRGRCRQADVLGQGLVGDRRERGGAEAPGGHRQGTPGGCRQTGRSAGSTSRPGGGRPTGDGADGSGEVSGAAAGHRPRDRRPGARGAPSDIDRSVSGCNGDCGDETASFGVTKFIVDLGVPGRS
jgi:hypothetical protein